MSNVHLLLFSKLTHTYFTHIASKVKNAPRGMFWCCVSQNTITKLNVALGNGLLDINLVQKFKLFGCIHRCILNPHGRALKSKRSVSPSTFQQYSLINESSKLPILNIASSQQERNFNCSICGCRLPCYLRDKM